MDLRIRFGINGVSCILTVKKLSIWCVTRVLAAASVTGVLQVLLSGWQEEKVNFLPYTEFPLQRWEQWICCTGYRKAFWLYKNVPICSDLRHCNSTVGETSCYFIICWAWSFPVINQNRPTEIKAVIYWCPSAKKCLKINGQNPSNRLVVSVFVWAFLYMSSVITVVTLLRNVLMWDDSHVFSSI